LAAFFFWDTQLVSFSLANPAQKKIGGFRQIWRWKDAALGAPLEDLPLESQRRRKRLGGLGGLKRSPVTGSMDRETSERSSMQIPRNRLKPDPKCGWWFLFLLDVKSKRSKSPMTLSYPIVFLIGEGSYPIYIP